MPISALSLLLPLLPGFVDLGLKVYSTFKNPPANPEEAKARLESLSQALKDMSVRVAAVELPK